MEFPLGGEAKVAHDAAGRPDLLHTGAMNTDMTTGAKGARWVFYRQLSRAGLRAGLVAFFVGLPVACTFYGLFPAGVKLLFAGFFKLRFEFALDHRFAAQFIQAAPETAGQAGQVGGAQRCGFTHLWAFDHGAEDVCLELHQEVVGHRATINAQGF